MSSEMEDKGELARSLHEKAMLAQIEGDYARAKKIHEENLQIEIESGDKKAISETLHHLGFVSHETGNVDDAKKYYSESLKLCEELGCKEGISSNLKRLALMAHDTDNLEEAYECYKKCLALKEEMGEKAVMLDLLHRAGNVAYVLGKTDDATHLYKKLFNLALELDDKESVGMALAQMHTFAIEQRKRFEGLMLLLCAHEIFMSIESNHFIETSEAIDRFKDMGYEDRILSIQNGLNSSSFEEIVKTASETLSQI